MKYSLILTLFLIPLFAFSQDSTKAFDPVNWEPPYRLHTPSDWDVERFLLPISFAPTIPFKGIEDIRFTPGWKNVASDDYWSYAFLWYLDGKQNVTASVLEKNLKMYYTGLTEAMNRAPSGEKSIVVKTKIKKAITDAGDLKTFYGSVYMLDYMENKPITLNCKVHLKSCEGQNNTYIFFELSPKPYSHLVWQSLDVLWLSFMCNSIVEK